MKFSILDWNIQWTSYYTKTHFSKIRPILNSLEIDILCLQEWQEFRHEKERLVNFKWFYNVFSKWNKDWVDVISSRFPILDSGEITPVSHTGRSMWSIIWATIKIGRKLLKIYNCHLEIDSVWPLERLEALKSIFADAKKHKWWCIVCWDLNTTIPARWIKRKIVQLFHNEKNESLIRDKRYWDKDERYMVVHTAKKEWFQDILDINKPTRCIDIFHRELFKLKLDWFFVRDIITKEVELWNYISDHRSIYVNCQI